jgi:BspA type Leucine rich repeat region (6 copies)
VDLFNNALAGGNIGNRALGKCTNLSNIVLSQAVNIGMLAFAETALQTVHFPKGVFIGKRAFMLCNQLKNISVAEEVTIKTQAFSHCKNLEEVHISGRVYIADDAFHDCKNLKMIVLHNSTDEEFEIIKNTLPAVLQAKLVLKNEEAKEDTPDPSHTFASRLTLFPPTEEKMQIESALDSSALLNK